MEGFVFPHASAIVSNNCSRTNAGFWYGFRSTCVGSVGASPASGGCMFRGLMSDAPSDSRRARAQHRLLAIRRRRAAHVAFHVREARTTRAAGDVVAAGTAHEIA